MLVIDAVWHGFEVLLVNFRGGDAVELARVSLAVEGAAAWVFGAGEAASRGAPDADFGHGVVGQAARLVIRGDRRAGESASLRSSWRLTHGSFHVTARQSTPFSVLSYSYDCAVSNFDL